MARPLRLEYAGALYHSTARGNARQDIFLYDEDRRRFFGGLEPVVARFHLVLHAYCLMSNHFHLLVRTPEANLSSAMRQLNGVSTKAFNRRHKQVGHVLLARFKAIVVEWDSYLLRNALPPVRPTASYFPCGSAPTVPSEMLSFAGPLLSMGTACLKSAARRECTIRLSVVS